MAIRIGTSIQPAGDQDTYPLMDSTYLKGGLLVVNTYNDITNDSAERQVGRLYYVNDEECFYHHDGSSINQIKFDSAILTDLEKVEYRELTSAAQLPTDATVLVVRFDGTGETIQTLPNLINVREGMRIFVQNHKNDDSTIELLAANSEQHIAGGSSYTIDPGHFAELVAEKASNNWLPVVEYDTNPVVPTSGIVLDDSTTSLGGVETINVEGATVADEGSNTAKLICGPDLGMVYGSYEQVKNVKNIDVLYPLQVEESKSGLSTVTPNSAVLAIKHDAYEPMHAPSFLAYLKEPVEIVGKVPQGYELDAKAHHNGIIWFDDIVAPAGAFIGIDSNNKRYSIEEADNLDPNVSGGTDYLISARIHMKGKAPSAGFVRLYLYNNSVDPFDPTGYLLDKNGQPMAIEKFYKYGEELGVLDVMGIVNAKGTQGFSVHVVDSLTNDFIELTDRTEGASGLMIQALTSTSKTGHGLLQFENDTMQNIEFSTHYLGADRMTLKYQLLRDETPVSYTAGTNNTLVDGMELMNRSGIKYGVVNNRLIIEDDGVHLADYNFGKVFSAEETHILRGKQITVEATTTTTNSSSRVFVVKWTGAPDAYTKNIITSWSNDEPTYETGWSQVSAYEIIERPLAADTLDTFDVTIPTDANNYAVIITTNAGPVQPYKVEIKDFVVNVKTPFIGYSLEAPELTGEQHLLLNDGYKEFVQDTLGYASLRYTVNNDDTNGLPMPAGTARKGAADVELDTSVNQIAGSQAGSGEGALKFTEDGHAVIDTQLLLWNEKAQDSTVKFWWAEVGPDGNLSKLADSEFTFTVPAGSKGTLHGFRYAHDFEDGDRIALRASANVADGAFLQCVSNNKPMVTIKLSYEDLVLGSSDTTDLVTGPYAKKLIEDRRVVEFSGITATTYSFPITIPDDVVIGDVTMATTVTGNRVITEDVDSSYNPTTNQMTVHVGSVTSGKIYISFWG